MSTPLEIYFNTPRYKDLLSLKRELARQICRIADVGDVSLINTKESALLRTLDHALDFVTRTIEFEKTTRI